MAEGLQDAERAAADVAHALDGLIEKYGAAVVHEAVRGWWFPSLNRLLVADRKAAKEEG